MLRDWQIWICTRLLSETKWVRFPHPAPGATKRRHSITDQCSELLPRTMRVQISLPSPMWGCGPTDEGARLRTLRSGFNSLHPLHISKGSRGLKHDDASVLTKRSGLDSRREFQKNADSPPCLRSSIFPDFDLSSMQDIHEALTSTEYMTTATTGGAPM